MKTKRLWKFLRVLVIIYIIIGIALYFIQDLIIFHPKTLSRNYSFQFNQPFKEINISPDGKRNLNFVQFFPPKKSKGIVLYFHGNKTNIERYAQFAHVFTNNNYEIWMIDYPGYGKTTGRRTEQAIYNDALLLYQLAIQKTPAKNIIIYGKSLGTGVASYVAFKNMCKKLVLETPYYSMSSITRHYVPVYPTALLRYSFPINEYLKNLSIPITIFHGTSDQVIPYEQSLKLKRDYPKIELITIPGATHNNLFQFPVVIQKIDSLLAG